MKDVLYEVVINNAHHQEGSIALDSYAPLLLGKVGGEVMLWLGDDKRRIRGRLERHGDANGTPVIHGGRMLRNWLLEHCQPGDTLEVRILGPVQFWLRRVYGTAQTNTGYVCVSYPTYLFIPLSR